MRSVFLTEIQIWRAGEIAHLMAAGLFPFLIWKLRGNGITVLLGSLFILLGFDYFNYDSAAVGVVIGIVLLALGNVVPKPTKSMQLMVIAFVVTAFGAGLYNQLNLIAYQVAHDPGANLSLAIRAFAATWMFGAAIILGVAILAFRQPRGALALACVLIVCCASMWDHRTPFQIYMENQIGKPSPLGDYIPVGKSVFWSDDLRLPWFIIDRPSYFSRNQAAGLVFKRETAMAFLEHEDESLPLKASSEVCESLERLGSNCALSSDAVQAVCKPGNADFVIVNREVDDLLPNRILKIDLVGAAPLKYGVYNCRSLIVHKTEHKPKFPFLRRPPVTSGASTTSASTSAASTRTGASASSSIGRASASIKGEVAKKASGS